MKLMLIGMAARGKTTLLERISDKGQRGIQENWGITRWVTAHWDSLVHWAFDSLSALLRV